MVRRTLSCLSALALTCAACAEEEEAPPRAAFYADVQEAGSEEPPDDLLVVPGGEGAWRAMWEPLKDVPTLHRPVSEESAQRLQALSSERAGVAEDDVSLDFMYVDSPGGSASARLVALYTDPRIVQGDLMTWEAPTLDVLRDALMSPGADGVSFNPNTPHSRYSVFSYDVDRLFLVRLIGFLSAEPAVLGQALARAEQARDADRPFEAFHYAIEAQERELAWEEAELIKVWALFRIDFPGAREQALGDLDGFVAKFGHSDETRALRVLLTESPS